MKFSIIIPTCNRAELLTKCLQSLLQQIKQYNISNAEIIITDDGSSDISNFVNRLEFPIVYTKGPQRGPAANRNNGAKHAKGEWLIFLDDDCVPAHDLIYIYKTAIENFKNIKVFEGSIIPANEKVSPLEYGPFNLEGGHLWSCNFCIHQQTFKQVNGFDEVFKYPHLEDNDLRLRLLNNKVEILFLKDVIVTHPWRKLNDGKRLASFQEMSIYFFCKHKIKYSLLGICTSIVKVHFAMMRNNFFSKDVINAFNVMFHHVGGTIKNYNKWNNLYKKKYDKKNRKIISI